MVNRGRSRQGKVILEELRKLTTHPRSDELYVLVRECLPRVSLGTVYRNLGQLSREGLALEIFCGDFVRYDGNVASHDHLLCRSCRRVWDHKMATNGATNGAANGATGLAVGGPAPVAGGGGTDFQVDGQYTIFYGLCRECRGGETSGRRQPR